MTKINTPAAANLTLTPRASGLTALPDGSIHLSSERHHVCLQAAWELEELAFLIPKAFEGLALRGVAGRIKELSGVLMGALHDEGESTDELTRLTAVSMTGFHSHEEQQ